MIAHTPDPRDAEIAQLTAENAALRADLNDARSNWESGAEELRQADLVREQLAAALKMLMNDRDVTDNLTQSQQVQVYAALLAAGVTP